MLPCHHPSRKPASPCSPCARRSRPPARTEASPPRLLSHDEIGPARLVGRCPHDGFGLLEIATRGGLGEAARLPSILPPAQSRGRHEDDRAHQADQDEIDSQDQQRPEPHLGHCPHLPVSAPGPHRQRIPSAIRSNHARDLRSPPGQQRRVDPAAAAGWQWSAAGPDSAKELGRVGRCDTQQGDRSSGPPVAVQPLQGPLPRRQHARDLQPRTLVVAVTTSTTAVTTGSRLDPNRCRPSASARLASRSRPRRWPRRPHQTVVTEASAVLNPDFCCIPTTMMPPTPKASGIPRACAGHLNGYRAVGDVGSGGSTRRC
jgi:hypothetical protein